MPSDSSLIQVTPAVKVRDAVTWFTDVAEQWARSAILMRDLITMRGGEYLHFFQPNQYYTTRHFGDAEAAVALSEGSPYKRSVELGYPALEVAARLRLLEANVWFFDVTHVFDREPAPVYMDDCCHYTLVGNQLLAESILGAPGPWRDCTN